mmetsp:Transcript_35628/g.78313  ORF Transcript_35628/g.78313 Transcript_35628/m.78313 type:complete len:113 (-) Transcript_35628:673-1011(-)
MATSTATRIQATWPLTQVVKSEWLQFEAESPQLSRVVNAIVDTNLSNAVDSSSARRYEAEADGFIPTTRAPIIRGARLRTEQRDAPSVRRAFTFDALPRSFSDASARHSEHA